LKCNVLDPNFMSTSTWVLYLTKKEKEMVRDLIQKQTDAQHKLPLVALGGDLEEKQPKLKPLASAPDSSISPIDLSHMQKQKKDSIKARRGSLMRSQTSPIIELSDRTKIGGTTWADLKMLAMQTDDIE